MLPQKPFQTHLSEIAFEDKTTMHTRGRYEEFSLVWYPLDLKVPCQYPGHKEMPDTYLEGDLRPAGDTIRDFFSLRCLR